VSAYVLRVVCETALRRLEACIMGVGRIGTGGKRGEERKRVGVPGPGGRDE